MGATNRSRCNSRGRLTNSQREQSPETESTVTGREFSPDCTEENGKRARNAGKPTGTFAKRPSSRMRQQSATK